MLQLSIKCWNAALNARGSRLIIVVVQLGAVKIYVAAVVALRKKEGQDETQFSLPPKLIVICISSPLEC
jgi:hypothetical protein